MIGRRFAWRTTLVLAVVWVLLWGEFTVGAALSGIVIALVVQALFPLPVVDELRRVHPWGFVVLIFTTLGGLVVASVQVAASVLRFGQKTQGAIIDVPLKTDSEFISALTAELVSLVPGSIVVEIAPNGLVVHVFDVHSMADVDAARADVLRAERRVVQAFGTWRQLAQVGVNPERNWARAEAAHPTSAPEPADEGSA